MTTASTQDWNYKFETEIGEYLSSLRPSVFIMGPSMEKEDNSAMSEGGALRKDLAQRCEVQSLEVITEHKEIERKARKFAKERLGKGFDLTKYELLVAQVCNVVAIIPDSPGSFAELGYFATNEGICPRMLILFNKKHKGARSYLCQGPLKAADHNHATIRYVDYGRPNRAWTELSKAIDIARAKMIHKT